MQLNGPGNPAVISSFTNGTIRQQIVEGLSNSEDRKIESAVNTFNNPTPVDTDKLENAVEVANKAMVLASYDLKFTIHEESGRLQVKVVNVASGEVIKEIPSKQMLAISANIKEMMDKFNKMVGVLVDELV
jgi:flagellar protein FlaG